MDADFKRKWVEALRGGKYEQGRGRLSTRQESSDDLLLCCIGVGFVVKCPEANVAIVGTTGASNHLGLTSEQEEALVNMNDGINGELQHSFAEIADYIEQNL